MKTTFRVVFAAVALLLAVNASAQDSPLQFGVKAGVNLSNFSGDVEDSKAKVGFVGGVTVDYHFTPDFVLMSGLEFTMKGAKEEYTDEIDGAAVKVTGKAKPMYLQLPIHIGYKLAIAEDTRIVFHAGPYLAYGLGGKTKIEYGATVGDTGFSKEEEYDFFGDDAAKRFDFGLGLGANVEFGKINVGLGYDFGLANISDDSDYKMRNMNAYLTVGYKF